MDLFIVHADGRDLMPDCPLDADTAAVVFAEQARRHRRNVGIRPVTAEDLEFARSRSRLYQDA